MRSFVSLVCVLFLILSLAAAAQQPSITAPAANSDPVYQQLQRVGPSSEAVSVSNLTLQRDAAKFRLSGTLTFLAPVEGKVTGAVFTGDGILTITPPLPQEERSRHC